MNKLKKDIQERRNKLILKLIEEGYNQNDIAEIFGLNKTRITQIKKHGNRD